MMRIVSLAPPLTDLLDHFDLGNSIVAATERCTKPASATEFTVLSPSPAGASRFHHPGLGEVNLDLMQLRAVAPTVIVGELAYGSEPRVVVEIQTQLRQALGSDVRLALYRPWTLDLVFAMFEEISIECGAGARGRTLAQRVKAQALDWGDNFYERTKNKRVTFLSGVLPMRLGGLWIPDMIHFASCHGQLDISGELGGECTWDEVRAYRPDVIIVAPHGYSLSESMKSFKLLEKLPEWETLPAVKRGEVIFCDGGATFYSPTHQLINGLAVLFSAIAGFESGYITPRESFYRLRWLELQRHRI